ncbi:MAG TPA: GNAT family N-acetyltransferase [Solirubrobacteraceae bacterium]|nr:GNAT family N-acetyltransferase [Solirubrobacteraceae bacterium]
MATGGSQIIVLDPLADRRWDEFVCSHPSSSIYHLADWSAILRSAYGFTPCGVALESDGRIVGVLPMMSSLGVVTRRRLRALPAVGSVDPLANTAEGRRALLSAACDLALESGARSFTLTARSADLEGLEPRLAVGRRFATFIAPLGDDPERLRAGWKKSANNLWRGLRKSEQAGVTVREGSSERDLRRFYAMYCATMRHHRSLPRSYRMFSHTRRALSEKGLYRLLLAEHDGAVVAGGVFCTWQGTVDLMFNASSQAHLALRPNHAIYWNAICWAIENGCRHYNMGEAPVDGSLGRFKAQWGGEPAARFRYEFTPGGSSNAAQALRRTSNQLEARRESTLSRVWGRTPLPATRAAGQLVYRFF